jgi:hypothetical protein
MQALREIDGAELRWVKPSWRKLQFELRAGEAMVATLAWTGGGRAVGQWDREQYRFSREGWLRPHVVVRGAAAAAVDEPIATFAYRGGTLTFPDGRAFVWKKPRRWTNERIWADGAGTELLRFRPSRGQASVALTAPTAAESPELPLLLLLGQFLLVVDAQDAAAAAATAAVIASS